jgi:hypothetical protein
MRTVLATRSKAGFLRCHTACIVNHGMHLTVNLPATGAMHAGSGCYALSTTVAALATVRAEGRNLFSKLQGSRYDAGHSSNVACNGPIRARAAQLRTLDLARSRARAFRADHSMQRLRGRMAQKRAKPGQTA